MKGLIHVDADVVTEHIEGLIHDYEFLTEPILGLIYVCEVLPEPILGLIYVCEVLPEPSKGLIKFFRSLLKLLKILMTFTVNCSNRIIGPISSTVRFSITSVKL